MPQMSERPVRLSEPPIETMSIEVTDIDEDELDEYVPLRQSDLI
jgi:hypothetical protein